MSAPTPDAADEREPRLDEPLVEVAARALRIRRCIERCPVDKYCGCDGLARAVLAAVADDLRAEGRRDALAEAERRIRADLRRTFTEADPVEREAGL
jgi:hypothetical protein